MVDARRREQCRAAQQRYQRTAKGRAGQRRYGQTDKGKAAARRYRQTAKGRLARKRYRQSAIGRAAEAQHSREIGARRVYVGQTYLGVVKSPEHAALIRAHIKGRLCAFIKRQQSRAQVENDPAR